MTLINGPKERWEQIMSQFTLTDVDNIVNKVGIKSNKSYILVETTKPVMAVKCCEDNSFAIVYLTQDKIIRKPNKKRNYIFQEYFVANINSNYFSNFLDSKISILDLVGYTTNKTRVVKINSKIYDRQVIEDSALTDTIKAKLFPDKNIFLKDMPIHSLLNIKKLASLAFLYNAIKLDYDDIKKISEENTREIEIRKSGGLQHYFVNFDAEDSDKLEYEADFEYTLVSDYDKGGYYEFGNDTKI